MFICANVTAKKATKSSGGETEFHLTCTVLVNGSPDGSGSTGDGDDYEDGKFNMLKN